MGCNYSDQMPKLNVPYLFLSAKSLVPAEGIEPRPSVYKIEPFPKRGNERSWGQSKSFLDWTNSCPERKTHISGAVSGAVLPMKRNGA